ncbi:MAG: sigma-E factor negative regulatory protein [Aestuariibacter sp.]
MAQSEFENLSALVDGETADADSIKTILANSKAQEKWQSYHLIKDGLRNELPAEVNFDIAGQVAKALEQEPAIVAPVTDKKSEQKPLLDNVVALFRQGGQFAVAASVAVAMILGYQQLNQPQDDPTFNAAPTLKVTGIQGGLSPVSLEQTRATAPSDVAEQKRKMNALLMDHEQQVLLKDVESKDNESTEETVDDQK